mmetsp:Transcript_34582/g.71403  ORF Transcript_34582/g.71403 Transcript_34582/m.71403 type:complete len:204 (+) Transcript_34582:519-1130(+)
MDLAVVELCYAHVATQVQIQLLSPSVLRPDSGHLFPEEEEEPEELDERHHDVGGHWCRDASPRILHHHRVQTHEVLLLCVCRDNFVRSAHDRNEQVQHEKIHDDEENHHRKQGRIRLHFVQPDLASKSLNKRADHPPAPPARSKGNVSQVHLWILQVFKANLLILADCRPPQQHAEAHDQQHPDQPELKDVLPHADDDVDERA